MQIITLLFKAKVKMFSVYLKVFYYSAHVLAVKYVIACLHYSNSMSNIPRALLWLLIYMAVVAR